MPAQWCFLDESLTAAAIARLTRRVTVVLYGRTVRYETSSDERRNDRAAVSVPTRVNDAIEVRSLSKTYRGLFGGPKHEALRSVDLTIPQGAAFGLIGLNGAGKTTLVKSLLDVVRPSSGSLRVLGGSPAD